MATEPASSRIVGVGGHEFVFQRAEPEFPARKVGDRRVVADWVHQLDENEPWLRATVHEHSDGAYEPTALYGVFTDFGGAAAVEVTIRWMQGQHAQQMKKAHRLQTILMASSGLLAVIAIVALAWR